jgi:hypothetical protein
MKIIYNNDFNLIFDFLMHLSSILTANKREKMNERLTPNFIAHCIGNTV